MMIDTATPFDEAPFGGYGSFADIGEWTDEEWAEYDAHVAAEMAAFDEAIAAEDAILDF